MRKFLVLLTFLFVVASAFCADEKEYSVEWKETEYSGGDIRVREGFFCDSKDVKFHIQKDMAKVDIIKDEDSLRVKLSLMIYAGPTIHCFKSNYESLEEYKVSDEEKKELIGWYNKIPRDIFIK